MYTSTMENLVRATLTGIAIGGFAGAVVKANQLALQAIVELNSYAIETACVMAQAVFTKIVQKRQQQNET